MRLAPLLFFIVLSGCKEPQTEKPFVSTEEINATIQSIKDTEKRINLTTYRDSGSYMIVTERYLSGAKFIEFYENSLTKISHKKEFYENGQIKEEGSSINRYGSKIGKWSYYSSSGKLDSLVNYDAGFRITYLKALAIAKKEGFKAAESQVFLTQDRAFWQVEEWLPPVSYNRSEKKIINIDIKTGKVTWKKDNEMFVN